MNSVEINFNLEIQVRRQSAEFALLTRTPNANEASTI